jgi:hypothetical protein
MRVSLALIAVVTAVGCGGGGSGNGAGAPPSPATPEPAPAGGVASTCPLGPQRTVDTSTVPTRTGTTWTPTSSAELTSALAAVVPGDEIVLDPQVAYVGPFYLKPQPAGDWIIIRSNQSTSASFPAAGSRVEKTDAARLAKVLAPNDVPGFGGTEGETVGAAPAFITTDGANHHYWIMGLEIEPVDGTATYKTLVQIGDRFSSTNQASSIVLDRVYVHGSANASIKHGVMLNGASLAIINSRLGDIHVPRPDVCAGAIESQAINSVNGSGPYKLDNNYISGSTQGFMFGGLDAMAAEMVPADITVTRNHVHKPISSAWRNSYLAKTGLELKASNRVLITGNYFENAWDNCPGENGAVMFRVTPRNQDGGAPFTNITDVKISSNKFINSPKGMSLLGSDDINSSGRMSCIAIANNLFDKIPGDFGNDPSTDGGMGRVFTLANGGNSSAGTSGGIQNLTIEHNTLFSTAGAAMMVWGAGDALNLNTGFIYRNNIEQTVHDITSGYDRAQPEGDPTLSQYFASGAVFSGNDFIGGDASLYAQHCAGSPCYFDAAASAVQFVNPAGGDYRLQSSSPDHDAATDGSDVGINDWSSATGIGVADLARDPQAD